MTGGEGFRLSPQQRRLWHLIADDGNAAVYRARAVVEIAGRLDVHQLAAALEQVVAAHPALRTRLVRASGLKLPLQCASEGAQLRFRRAPAQTALAQLLAETDEHAWDGFAEPPLGALCAESATGGGLLVLTLPALLADAISLRRLVRELAAAYAGEPLAEGLPYGQFAEWQSQMLDDEHDEELAAGRRYWQQLAAVHPEVASGGGVDLPFAGAATGAFDPRCVELCLDAETRDRLEDVASGLGSDLEALTLAAWRAHLGQLGRRDHGVIGWTSDGRGHEALADAIGPFARVVPLAWRGGGEVPVAELVSHVEEIAGEAAEHQDAFAFALPETGSPQPFCTAAYELLDETESHDAGDARFTLRRHEARGERFAVKLEVARRPAGLALRLVYDAARVSTGGASTLAGQMQRRLLAAAGDARRTLAAGALLGAEERRWLIEQADVTRTDVSGEPLVHQLIAARARRAGERDAVIDEHRRFSYAELEAESNRLAHHLRALGVGPEVVVGLCLDRSAVAIVALLAVLKAGGAYLPVDPSLPPERRRTLITQAGARLLLGGGEALAQTAAATGLAAVDLERDRAAIAARASEDPAIVVAPAAAAYVLFTSGSTGQPKGVVVEHRQLRNYVLGIRERLGIADGASFATVSTLAADLGNTAIFPALVGGGCLHVVAPERLSDPERLAELCEQHTIDVLKIVPSHLQALLGGTRPAAVLPRRALVCGGEALGWELVERLRRLAPECRIFNHYGPTETTVGILAGELGTPQLSAAVPRRATVPLGRPLANSCVYLVDRELQLVAIGATGELALGGAGVARGYCGQPALTAERFIPDPLSGVAGARVYRTGDLGRWLPGAELADAGLEFQGRRDHQVKLRGFRVELGEIEAALQTRPEIAEAVVATHAGEGGAPRLVAWVVARGTLDTESLRAALRAVLPEVMVPAFFLELPALPRNANGKIDRRALPAPEEVLARRRVVVAPRSERETRLAALWRELLGVEEVGIHDNFFDLGGHSLLATQALSRLRRDFAADLELRDFFEHPTIAALAAFLGAEPPVNAGLLRCPPGVPPPLSFAQERLWFLHLLDPSSPAYNAPAAVRLEGRLDTGALTRALAEIVRRHAVLRTRFGTGEEGRPVQIVEPGGRLELARVDLRRLPPTTAQTLALGLFRRLAHTPFNLRRGPLVRCALARLGEEHHILVLVLHHIVSDAWSKGILVRELAALYRAFVAGEPSPLPALGAQYADYAWNERATLDEARIAELLGARLAQLGNAPGLELAAERTASGRPDHRGARQHLRLDGDRHAELLRLARHTEATPFLVLFAAFATVLGAVAEREALVLSVTTAHRRHAEVETMIGFFLNLLAVRADLTGDPPFDQLVARLRAAMLEAHAQEDLPFHRLVEALRGDPRRGQSAASAPVLRVNVDYQPASTPLSLPGLSVVPLDLDPGITHFDLTLLAYDGGTRCDLVLEHRPELWSPATVRGWLGDLDEVLAAVTARPQTRLSELTRPIAERARRRLRVRGEERAASDGATLRGLRRKATVGS